MTKRSLSARVLALERVIAALQAGRALAPEDARWMADALRLFRARPVPFDSLLGLMGPWRNQAMLENRNATLCAIAAGITGPNSAKARKLAERKRWFQIFGSALPRLSPNRIRLIIADHRNPST